MKPHPILYPFSLLYGFIVWLRNLFFDIGILRSVDVSIPVISVGNITAGGSGKTPMVIAIGKYFLEKAKRVAVISRGYGRVSQGTVVVSDGHHLLTNAAQGGDETVLIAQQLPTAIVIADEKRVRAVKKAVAEFGAEVIILDDGFQHRYLKRTLDIVLIDGTRSPFDTMMLPAGYKRESLQSLYRADAVVVTKVQSENEAKSMLDHILLSEEKNKFSSSYQAAGIRNIFGNVRQSIAMLKGHSVIAVSGIASPASFIKEIEKSDGIVKKTMSFRDHHNFTGGDVRRLIEVYRRHNADFILTTEKDAVKLNEFRKELSLLPIFALCMDVTIHQEMQWKQLLADVI